MSQLTLIPIGAGAAVVLPDAVIESVGLRIGDKLDLTVGDQQLILRPVEDSPREARLAEITREVFEQRQDAYRRLA
jgi:antitoxin component of MazEF toxin-antitoxin module